ncbi:MAG TPA: XTP/dITP diphosphatase [Pseudogracilibacillus sp.]|nr:XTP/dITP diphosphatase [Pseudogracilibacillus sp.]
MKEIIIASKNKGKINEFQQLLKNYGINVKSLLDFAKELPHVEETGATFQENAALKAETIADKLHTSVLADDSGLVVDVLDGKPGVFSARYAGEPTNDLRNYEKVLREMNKISNKARTARFICVLALAIPGEKTIFKEGICEGKIATKPLGTNGFGYDPIFVPDGYSETMAQLEESEKNKISHRYRALVQLKNWLDANVNRYKGE